ncbi:trichodiene oxygenase [Colletotrichum chrysophilum]|uniref:Trichodiene oxygenase n=1 Tax=Colletotrichum chrysophilum TaxID=1836956 RepID=A0AAD9AQZ9_9PEZI|nr:trichodiene oxygenase [Colletotrichum chrysophilum]
MDGIRLVPDISWAGVSWPQLLGVGFALWLLYGGLLAIYRVTLHPLAKFPGPKLAGATFWYEVWYDVVLWGRFTHEIKRMHEIYGPIVRINPDEVHCNDPEFVEAIYANGAKKRNKSEMFVAGFANDLRNGGFGTVDHVHHKLRRAAASKYFSRTQIQKLEWVIHQHAQRLADKFLAYRGQGPFDGASAYSCYTADIVSDYCFGEGLGFLQQPTWEPNFKEAVYTMFHLIHIMRHFPWTTRLMEMIPVWVIKPLSAKIGLLMETVKIKLPELVRQMKARHENGIKRDRVTVLHSLLESDLPPEELTVKRLAGEANVFLSAGTETTASALTICTYHLLRNPDAVAKIRAELATVKADPKELPSWATLEGLPYFNAVLMESLRLMYGSPSRLPRVAPDEDVVYQGTWTPPGGSAPVDVSHVIPRGYAYGMSAYIMHTDERLFPEPSKFLPERWLDENGQRKKGLERFLLTFSKGSRQCLGMQLAYCELHVAVAAVVLRALPYMRLYETTDVDVEYDFDLAVSMPKKGSKGVRLEMI